METYHWIILAVFTLLLAPTAFRKALESVTTVVEVPAFMKAVVFVKGAPPRLLETGRHTFWTRNVQSEMFDDRDQWIQIAGQELITKDGAPVRLSVAVLRAVTDPMLYATVQDSWSRVYVAAQLAVREHVLARTLDELVEQRSVIDAALKDELEQELAPLGMQIEHVAIRDLTLIGDTKRAFAEVIQAQLRAKAKLEQARGEAAAMRSLLNTAELVRKNPELLQLRTLQQLESGTHQVHLTLGAPTPPKETE